MVTAASLLCYIAFTSHLVASADLRAQISRYLPTIKGVRDICDIDCLQDYGPCDDTVGSPTTCHICLCQSCLDNYLIAPCCTLSGDIPFDNCLQDNVASASSAGLLSSTISFYSTPTTNLMTTTAGTTNVMTTTAPTTTTSSDDCADFVNIADACSTKYSNYDNLPFSAVADCLCYSSGTLQPQIYDSALSKCEAFYQTASPDFVVSLEATLPGHTLITNPCALRYVSSSAVSVNAFNTGTTATTTSARPGQSIIGHSSGTGPVTVQVTVTAPSARMTLSTSSALGVTLPQKQNWELLPVVGGFIGLLVI